MIEISVREEEGVRFIDKVKVVSWEKRKGLPVQLIDELLLRVNPEMDRILKMLWLERVDEDENHPVVIYAQRPVNDLFYLLLKWWCGIYFKVIRFAYRELRVFKQIPPGEYFSWRYFTPYTWLKR